MVQKHAWVKDPFKLADRPRGFKEIELKKKFIDMVSDSTLRLTFMKR